MNKSTLTLLILSLALGVHTADARQSTRSGKSGSNISMNRNDGSMRWIRSNDDSRLEVESDGEIRFLDDDSGIQSISSGGYFRMIFTDRDSDIRLEVRPTRGGGLEHVYRLEGRELAYDDDARQTLQPIFLTIVRETGLYVNERVARILREGGVSAVLSEVEQIESGSAVARYLTATIEQADPRESELSQIAELAQARIASSGTRARFLGSAAPKYLAHEASLPAYFDAIRTIQSSGDKTRTLTAIVEADPGARTISMVLDVASTIRSSGDRSRLLIAAAPHYTDTQAHRVPFFEAVSTIPSSGDHARVLRAILAHDDLSEATLQAILESVKSISSSGDASRVLIAAAGQIEGERLVDAYLSAADTIGSSGDRSRVLAAIM